MIGFHGPLRIALQFCWMGLFSRDAADRAKIKKIRSNPERSLLFDFFDGDASAMGLTGQVEPALKNHTAILIRQLAEEDLLIGWSVL